MKKTLLFLTLFLLIFPACKVNNVNNNNETNACETEKYRAIEACKLNLMWGYEDKQPEMKNDSFHSCEVDNKNPKIITVKGQDIVFLSNKLHSKHLRTFECTFDLENSRMKKHSMTLSTVREDISPKDPTQYPSNPFNPNHERAM